MGLRSAAAAVRFGVALGIAAMLSAPRPAVLRAQAPQSADAAFLLGAYDRYRAMAEASPTRGVRWQHLGPTNVSGRATAVAVAGSGKSRRIYAAFATSGVWASDDQGVSWRAIFEHYPSTSVGDIAVAPSRPDILWVGTGEANIRNDVIPGAGVYLSTDAGKTWRRMGLAHVGQIGRIVVDPHDPDHVVVAALGLLLVRTRIGLYVRAVTQDRDTAEAMGINIRKIDLLIFSLGTGLAGVAGVVLAMLEPVTPSVGQAYIVPAFLVVILGGLGSLIGTTIASIMVGLISAMTQIVWTVSLSQVFLLLFVVAFIQFRPRGVISVRSRALEET